MKCNNRGFCITQGNIMKVKALVEAVLSSKRITNFRMWPIWNELRYTILPASM